MTYDSQTAILNRHDFEKSFTNEFDQNQTSANLITPTSGKVLKIVGAMIITEASSGYIRLHFTDDEDDQSNTILTTYAAAAPATGYVPLLVRGDQNAPLKITSTLGADQNYFILVNYEEE